MAEKKEWFEDFRRINGRAPTLDEYAAADNAGEFNPEDNKAAVSHFSRKGKIGLVIGGVAALLVLISFGTYFVLKNNNNSAAKSYETSQSAFDALKGTSWENSSDVRFASGAVFKISWDDAGVISVTMPKDEHNSDVNRASSYTNFSYRQLSETKIVMSYYQKNKQLVLNYPLFVDGVGGAVGSTQPVGDVEYQVTFKLDADLNSMTLTNQRQRYFMTNTNGADLGENVRKLKLDTWSPWRTVFDVNKVFYRLEKVV
ncbi:hypothetical protein OfM1_11340 [Lactovum odontotermitis]